MRTAAGIELMDEYPFKGVFYETYVVDEALPLIDRETSERVVLETDCDIQQASLLGNAGFKISSYNVYFPLEEKSSWEEIRDKFGPVVARRGLYFRADMWGYEVDGIVEGVGASMLGGCVVQIKDKTE